WNFSRLIHPQRPRQPVRKEYGVDVISRGPCRNRRAAFPGGGWSCGRCRRSFACGRGLLCHGEVFEHVAKFLNLRNRALEALLILAVAGGETSQAYLSTQSPVEADKKRRVLAVKGHQGIGR